MITTDEAARRLGVSVRRVQELVRAGQLSGRKIAGVWLVGEASVDKRAQTVSSKGGRPARGRGKSETTFTLMNRKHEIARVVYNVSRKEFTAIGSDVDCLHAPLGLLTKRNAIALSDFNRWWRGRGIPQAREGLAGLLDGAGVSVPEELIQRNLGLSLSDQYWIRPENSGLKWEDINFFNNSFEKVSLSTAAFAVDGKRAQASPDNTSDGNLEKFWACHGTARCLFKGGTRFGQEPYNEVVATALHQRLLRDGQYVAYWLEGTGANALCACGDFLTDQEEYVPAVYVERCLNQDPDKNSYEHYLACCESLGVADAQAALDRMIVCDDIIANCDRHFRNFGLIRNVETLECRCAPIFDSGSSLWFNVSTSDLAAGEHSFSSKQFFESPAKQMLLVNDFSWLDLSALDGFVDEAMDILTANEALSARLPCIRAALEWRVERMRNIAEWN